MNKIISANYNFDENNKDLIVDSLNQIIRQIKIRKANSSANNNIDSIFELNKKIKEINSTVYIK